MSCAQHNVLYICIRYTHHVFTWTLSVYYILLCIINFARFTMMMLCSEFVFNKADDTHNSITPTHKTPFGHKHCINYLKYWVWKWKLKSYFFLRFECEFNYRGNYWVTIKKKEHKNLLGKQQLRMMRFHFQWFLISVN